MTARTVTIEFTPAEILHLCSDRPNVGMVGPRFTAWSKLAVAARDIVDHAIATDPYFPTTKKVLTVVSTW